MDLSPPRLRLFLQMRLSLSPEYVGSRSQLCRSLLCRSLVPAGASVSHFRTLHSLQLGNQSPSISLPICGLVISVLSPQPPACTHTQYTHTRSRSHTMQMFTCTHLSAYVPLSLKKRLALVLDKPWSFKKLSVFSCILSDGPYGHVPAQGFATVQPPRALASCAW